MTRATATLRSALTAHAPSSTSSWRTLNRLPVVQSAPQPAANEDPPDQAANGPHPPPDAAAYFGLVERVARRLGRGLPPNVQHEELVSAGMEGLVRATRRYDPARADRFATYAEFRIKGAMLDEMRRHDMMSRGGRLTRKALERKVAQLTAELGHPPTDEELAETLGLTVEQYRHAIRDLGDARVVSLEHRNWNGQPRFQPVDTSRNPEEILDDVMVRKQLWTSVERLGKRERLVVEMYFRDGKKLKEIATRIGTTDSRVCQIKREAIAKLRGSLAA